MKQYFIKKFLKIPKLIKTIISHVIIKNYKKKVIAIKINLNSFYNMLLELKLNVSYHKKQIKEIICYF